MIKSVWRVFCWLILATIGLPLHSVSACYYMSPTGSDLNSGTAEAPFATPEKARAAMQRSGTKCVNIGQGTYKRSVPIILTSADNGETWVGNPGDPVRSALFDGQRLVTDIFLILGGSNITIDGITMFNVIYRGVGIHGGVAFPVGEDLSMNVAMEAASGNIVKNTEVYNIFTPEGMGPAKWNVGGVVVHGNVPNTQILNNYFHDMNGMGMRLSAEGGLGDDISNGVIQNNVVLRTVQIISDGGGIYVQDINHQSTNILINHNYIADYQGPSNNTGHAVYLDQAASNVTVTNNVMRAYGRGAPGTSALLLSCGNNNAISNNIIDLGTSAMVAPFASLKNPSGPCTSMSGVTFTKNIVVSHFAGPQVTNFFGIDGFSYECGGAIPTNPSISNNMYHNSRGSQERTDASGVCAGDSSPIHSDPLLISQYALDAASPALSGPMYFVQLAGGWGPPGFVLP